MKENLVRSHVIELRNQADLGTKPKSVQPIRREVTRPSEQTGVNSITKHVQKLKSQAEPVYSKECIEELRKILPDEPLDMIIWRLKDEDRRKEDKRLGRRRGFGFF